MIGDWLQDNIAIDVVDGAFFATSRNLPLGWEGKTVLVENAWYRVAQPGADGEGKWPLRTPAAGGANAQAG